MVKLLFLKMLRDMKKSLAAYGICLLIVGVGFCGFCVMSVAKDHLLVSRDLLYEKSAFTEGFAEVYEAPAAIKDKLADIPGIGEVQARIIKEARLTDIGDGNARLKLISYEKGGRNVPMLRQNPWPYKRMPCGLFLAWTHFCSGKTAPHLPAMYFRVIFGF